MTKEVIKYTTDPETEKEPKGSGRRLWTRPALIERCGTWRSPARQEIQSLKEAKPQVQTKEVVQEILQFQEDPQTKRGSGGPMARAGRGTCKKQVDLERERASQEEKIQEKEEELAQGKEVVVQQEVTEPGGTGPPGPGELSLGRARRRTAAD